MQHLPLEIQTLYAELLERLTAYEAERDIGHLPGSFVLKNVKGQEYYYFQHFEPGGAKRQTYIGRRDASLDAVARKQADARADLACDVASIDRLASLLRTGGATVTDTASARVLKGLADASVFRLGGVLVGTQAFLAIGNALGVRWGEALRTQDIDLAAPAVLGVALPRVSADVPGTLASLEMGFLPVPALDPDTPSTSYKVRGQSLRVDVLAPASRRSSRPVSLPRFNTSAQPLRFLDYVMELPLRAAVINGGATLVNVPDPGRFALHKLVVAGERSATSHTKREKDLRQSAQILEVLTEERRADVSIAWEALAARGPAWVKRADQGLDAMARIAPEVAARTRETRPRS